jgi:hypothetical protein
MSAVTDFASIAADMERIKAEREPKKPEPKVEAVFGQYGWAYPTVIDTAPAEYNFQAPDYDGS